MRAFSFRGAFTFSLLLVAVVFVGLFLSFNSTLADGGPAAPEGGGGDGFSPIDDGSGQTLIRGRFFNDVNGNGTKEDFEEWIYSDGTACSLYTGAQMNVSGLSARIAGTSYPPDECMFLNGFIGDPIVPTFVTSYLPTRDTEITAQIPSGWRCSPNSSVCPVQIHNSGTSPTGSLSIPIGIQRDSINLSLSVNPSPLPLSAKQNRDLTANVTGGATGNINYTFWWNCDSSASTFDDAKNACGDPTTDSSVGQKADDQGPASGDASFTTAKHIYAPGTYTAKVVVERGSAPSVERRVTFTVASTPPTTGYIIGRVFNDKNGNGSRDAGEPNIQDVGIDCVGNGTVPIEMVDDVKIERVSGPTYFSVKPRDCNEEGPFYATGLLQAGQYEVTVVPPSGWVRTTPNVTTGVAGGQLADPNPWFGIRRESFINGIVFRDDNGNGVPDNGEQTLISAKAGGCGYATEIILSGAVVSGVGGTNFSSEADRCLSGSQMPWYSSPDLKPGTYTVSLAAPPGWKSTTDPKTAEVRAGNNWVATDDSWLWFGVQPLGIPQGDHWGASGIDVGSSDCKVNGWAGDPNYPAGDINIRVKKDGVVVAGPVSADQLNVDGDGNVVTADDWWVGNGCAAAAGDSVSCYFGVASPMSIYSSMSDGLSHLILVEAEDVDSAGVSTGVWVPLAVGNNENTPKILQCKPPGKVQIERVGASVATKANVDSLISESCAEGSVCSDNPSLFSGVDPSGHGAHASNLSGYNETVATCTYPVGGSECSVTTFSDPTIGCTSDDCGQAIMVTEGQVTKVVFKYTPDLPDLITNHQPITINGTLTTGSTLTFTSNVKNQGTGTAIGGSIGRWCIDGTGAECAGTTNPASQLNLATPTYGSFTPGLISSSRTSNGWTPTIAKSYTIWWCADVTNVVIESDETNNCHSAPVTVNAAPNNAPVANAGLDQNVDVGTLVNLDGSASYDPDNDPLTYSWSFDSKPGGSTATFSNSNSETPSFTADKEGIYNVRLTVSDGVLTDDDGMQVTASVVVPSGFSLSCSDLDPEPDPPCTVTVFASSFFYSFSTLAEIKVIPSGGYNGSVQLSVVDVSPSVPIGFLDVYTPDGIIGSSEYGGGTFFKARVKTSEADPLVSKTFTVTMRGVDTGNSTIRDDIVLSLIIRASDPGGGEQ